MDLPLTKFHVCPNSKEVRNGFYANAGRVWGDLERDPYNLP